MGATRCGDFNTYWLLYIYGGESMTTTKKMKRCDYRHIICITITLGFLVCGVFFFPDALGRVIEGVRDFGLSIAYYFCEIFSIPHSVHPTVNDYPKMPFFGASTPDTPVLPSVPIPNSWTGFQTQWVAYWKLWATWDNFAGYFAYLSDGLYTFCKVLFMLLPCFLILIFLFRQQMKNKNNDYNKDSRPLRVWKWISAHIYCPIRNWLSEFMQFVRERRVYKIIWLCLGLFYFNALTILLEFLAFYFYFVVSFDVINIYRQVYKLFVDLVPITMFIPFWLWVIIGLWIFDKIRKRIGYAKLEHNERKNCGFINERALTSLIVGTMGKGKTTLLTSMCLSTEVMFRDKAFELLLECDLKFPNFPWINLENALRWAIHDHAVYNLATCRKFIRKKRTRFEQEPCPAKLYDYDYKRYGLTYNDNLAVVDIWKVLEDYTQLYFIYIMESSLLISNYSIRSDMLISDLGNFPLWNGDFFRRDSRLIDSFSHHAHIIDFNILRLARSTVENSKFRNAFEFGIVAVSEIGKERLNQKTSQARGLKARGEETNQENDGFNDGLKMARHRATVCNFCFLKIISDEQRAMSLGADARELFDVINIRDKEEIVLLMPFFSLEELLYSWVFGKFRDLYMQYRYNRGDNTLLMHIIKGISAKFNHYYNRIYNVFGCYELQLQVESGSMDGNFKDKTYYISPKKDYSKRFATDCFADFFREKALTSPVGLNDMDEYETERARWEELKKQSSYFIRDLEGLKENTEE